MKRMAWVALGSLLLSFAFALVRTAAAQGPIRLASTQGMPSPCSRMAASLPWPFGHGKCDSRECWNDPNPVCTMQQLPNGVWMNTWRWYMPGWACRWEPFGTEDCTNSITNAECYRDYVWIGPVPGCTYTPEFMVVRRDFCAR